MIKFNKIPHTLLAVVVVGLTLSTAFAAEPVVKQQAGMPVASKNKQFEQKLSAEDQKISDFYKNGSELKNIETRTLKAIESANATTVVKNLMKSYAAVLYAKARANPADDSTSKRLIKLGMELTLCIYEKDPRKLASPAVSIVEHSVFKDTRIAKAVGAFDNKNLVLDLKTIGNAGCNRFY